MKALRLWFACTSGFMVSTLMNWDNALFIALFPLFILTEITKWNGLVFVMLFISIAWVAVQVSMILGFFSDIPILMALVVAMFLAFKCNAMHTKITYLFGFSGLLIGSLLLNIGSYHFIDLTNLTMSILTALGVAMLTCALAFWLFPDPQEIVFKTQPSANILLPSEQHRQTVIVWFVAFLVFIVCQWLYLIDSTAAQASILILLAPLTHQGAINSAKVRIIGTLYGCSAGMIIQVILYSWYDNTALYLLAFSIAAGYFCFWLGSENSELKGIGLAALMGLIVPLVNNSTPGDNDAFYAIVYRSASIVIAVVIGSLLITACHIIMPSQKRVLMRDRAD